MGGNELDFWTDATSVLFTSFWGWSPEDWGTVGWTGQKGHARRSNLLKQLTDPFITVGYSTGNPMVDPAMKGMITGYMLVSHETGDRDEFTHPDNHALSPEKWRHSLRGLRGFTYLPEYRPSVRDFDPAILRGAQSVGAMGKVLTDRAQIQRLREIPCVEVPCYSVKPAAEEDELVVRRRGPVRAGPASEEGYIVSGGTKNLKRELYVLRLAGNIDNYLGREAAGRKIFKVGLAVSPDLRRQTFHRSMPEGAFCWKVDKTSSRSGFKEPWSFEAAVAGENAIKAHLAACAESLGGEFYLATEADIEKAWIAGHAAARSFGSTV